MRGAQVLDTWLIDRHGHVLDLAHEREGIERAEGVEHHLGIARRIDLDTLTVFEVTHVHSVATDEHRVSGAPAVRYSGLKPLLEEYLRAAHVLLEPCQHLRPRVGVLKHLISVPHIGGEGIEPSRQLILRQLPEGVRRALLCRLMGESALSGVGAGLLRPLGHAGY